MALVLVGLAPGWCGLVQAAEAEAADVVAFHAEWEGRANAVMDGKTLSPSVAEAVEWSSPEETPRALQLAAATRLAYAIDAKSPIDAGSIELQMRPERAPAAAGEILCVKGRDGSSVTLAFVPAGPRWMFRLEGSGAAVEIAAWRDEIRYGQWNHIVLTWGEDATASLYVDGKWLRSQPFAGRMGKPSSVEVQGAAGTGIAMGPFLLYRRCLTASQALLLSTISGQPAAERLVGIEKQIRSDDEAAERRRELVGSLKGKVGRVYHTRGRAPGAVPLPEGIEAEGIRPEDLGKIDLSRFRVVYFPQGPHFQIAVEQYPAIQDYVRRGGGYVGDCQGAYFASDKLKLLPIDCYSNNIWGLYKIAVRPHFLTDGRRGEMTMHFGNGPIMVPGAGCEVIATYAMKLPGDAVPAAMVAGMYGAGRVILFGPHPLGEKVAFKGTAAHFSGKLLGTERMFVNALLLAAGLVDDGGASQGR